VVYWQAITRGDVTVSVFWCGVDVSKKSLDSAILSSKKGKHRTFHADNKVVAYQRLLDWALKTVGPDCEVRFCMESTGDYGVEFGLWLVEQGYHVSVVNPAWIKFFGMGEGRLNKTDKADAKLIADYATQKTPDAWDLTDPVRRKLFRLHRRREQLLKAEVAEGNRKECPSAIGDTCLASINRVLKVIRKELALIEAELMKIICADPDLKSSLELIASVPVLAEGSAIRILAEMPPLDKCESAQSWVAAAGGQPNRQDSGTSLKKTKMNRGGKKSVRAGLWVPALKGIGTMPELRSLYDRLIERGKTHFQALLACVRKLLSIVYGILKSKTPYKAPQIQAKPTPT